jgi:hypothetical protein
VGEVADAHDRPTITRAAPVAAQIRSDERADEYQPNEFGGYDCVIDLTDT